MDVNDLVDKYFEQIAIEVVDYVPVDDAVHDAAYITLNIPLEMLRGYSKLKGLSGELPDGAEFWEETNFVKRLRDSDKSILHEYQPLGDILDSLEEYVEGTYQKLINSERIRLDITEIPEYLLGTAGYKKKASKNHNLFVDYGCDNLE